MRTLRRTKGVFVVFGRHSWSSHWNNKGITLLLVIVILSALLSISIGIFNVIFGQILISGEVGDSFTAFYAADEGTERTLYRDRVLAPLCTPSPTTCTWNNEGTPNSVDTNAGGGCYTANLTKTVNGSTIDSVLLSFGQYRCGTNPARVVKRGIETDY